MIDINVTSIIVAGSATMIVLAILAFLRPAAAEGIATVLRAFADVVRAVWGPGSNHRKTNN